MTMTAERSDFTPLDRQLFERTMGEAVAELAKQRYSTTKALAKAWGIDVTTAENVRKGHIGIRALFAAIRCEGWGFLGPLGDEVIGETRHDAELRHFNQLIQEAEDARENLVRLRTRREVLERKAGEIGGLRDRQGSVQNG